MTNGEGSGTQGDGCGLRERHGVARRRFGRAAGVAIVLVLTVFAGVTLVPPAEAQPPIEWTRQFGAVGPATDVSFALDAAGNVYVVGYTYGVLADQASAGSYDAFVRKHDADGNAFICDRGVAELRSWSSDLARGSVHP